MLNMPEIPANLRIHLQTTPFGSVALLWSIYEQRPFIFRILISRPKALATQLAAAQFPAAFSSSCAEIDSIGARIEAFLNGEDIRFTLDNVRLDLCSGFQHSVLLAEYAIQRGRVSSYGLIAGYLQVPKSARAVGTALATNPFPIVIPCHRAVRSDRTLGGYQGGLAMKCKLLQMEGVPFRDAAHVAQFPFFYGESPNP